MVLGKGGDWREVAHQSWTGNSLGLAFSLGICTVSILLVLFLGCHVALKVLLIALEVLCTWEGVLEEDDDSEEHLGTNILSHTLEFIQVHSLLLSEDLRKQGLDILLGLETVQEDLATQENRSQRHAKDCKSIWLTYLPPPAMVNWPSLARPPVTEFSIGICERINRTSSWMMYPSRSKSYLLNSEFMARNVSSLTCRKQA